MIRGPKNSIALILVFLIQTLWNISLVSAQLYLNNHQQFMHSVDWESIIARAIDNADDKNYVIAGNMVPSKNPKVTRPLLTKLGKNSPESNPFDIQWARTYITPGEPDQPSGMNIDVKDVLHTTQNEYVIAGQARRDFDSPYEAFLFHTDSLGNPIAFMMYRDLHILNSVVQHPNGQGFVAVGQSASTQQDQGFQAAILSVNNDLEPLCYKQVIGAFQGMSRAMNHGNFCFLLLCFTCYMFLMKRSFFFSNTKLTTMNVNLRRRLY